MKTLKLEPLPRFSSTLVGAQGLDFHTFAYVHREFSAWVIKYDRKTDHQSRWDQFDDRGIQVSSSTG